MSRAAVLVLSVLLNTILSGCSSSNGTFAHARQPQSNLEARAVNLVPDGLDFGEVWETDRFQWEIRIANRGDEEIEIEGFSRSCNCADITPNNLIIPKGETCRVCLTLDLRPKLDASPSEVKNREFRVEITPRPRGQAYLAATWVVHGRVKPAVRLTPPFPELGRWSEFDQPIRPAAFKINAIVSGRELEVVPEHNFWTVACEPRGDDSYVATVKPRSNLPIGGFECPLLIRAKHDTDSRVVPATKIVLRGEILADIQSEPTSISFGAKKVGVHSGQTFQLRSLASRPFAVQNIHSNSATTSVIQLTDGYAPHHTLRVEQKIEGTGLIEKEASFKLIYRDGGETQIRVPIEYHGFPK